MSALMIFIIPPAIMVFTWRKFYDKDALTLKRAILYYIVFSLVLNAIDWLVVTYIFRENGGVYGRLNKDIMFAVKYMLMSCTLSVAVPYLSNWFKIYLSGKQENSGRQSIIFRCAAAVYALLLCGLNLIRIFENNFWGDEAYTIRLSRMSVQDMLHATALDVHPPLYYLLVWAACKLFGEHGWVYHFVSLVPYVIGLLFFLTIVWKRFGFEVSVLMITFTSIMFNALIYNVEARMYSLAAMFLLLAYYALWLILDNDRKISYVLFVLASLCAAYTHYYAMMSVAFFYLALLIRAIMKKTDLRKVLLVYGFTIAGYLPWLAAMISTFKRTADSFWITEIPRWSECLLFLFYSRRWYSISMLILLAVSVVWLIVREYIVLTYNRKNAADTSGLCFWLVWGIIAAIGTIALGKTISVLIRPALLTRYLYPVSVVAWMVVSVAITKLNIRKILFPIVLATTLITHIPVYREIYTSEKWHDSLCKNTEKYLENAIGETDIVLTNCEHLSWTIFSYYFPDIENKFISAGFDGFESDVTYWLAWADDLSELETIWLNDCGYNATEVYHEGMLGETSVHIYQLTFG